MQEPGMNSYFKHFIKLLAAFLVVSAYSNSTLAREFSVLTYNIQMRPILNNNRYKAPRIAPKLNHYDIVSLQESFAKKDLLMEGVDHACRAHFTDKRNCLCLVDSGLSTLSRFPIIMTKTEHYASNAGFQDIIASKGILLTRLDIDGLALDVYTTHMLATGGSCGKEARYDQARQIIEFIKANSPLENSILVIGDFNMSPERVERKFVDFHPNHYSDEQDMINRTRAFQLIMYQLNLSDIQDTLQDDKIDDIERMLFRSGLGHELKPISVNSHADRFVDERKAPLSDGVPLAATFSLTSVGN